MYLQVFFRQACFFPIVLFWVIQISVVSCFSFEASDKKFWFDYLGTSVFYGESRCTTVGPDPTGEYQWYSASVVIGKDLTSYLSVEGHLGCGYLTTEKHGRTPTAEVRLKWNLHYKWLYFCFGAGGLYADNSQNITDLAEENYFSILEADTGLRFKFETSGKVPMEFQIGYQISHISSPVREGEEGDSGWNVGAVHLNLLWYF